MQLIPNPRLNKTDEFQDELAERISIREHKRDPQNSRACLKMGLGMSSKHVVLVDEQDNVLGIEDKLQAHNANTRLHRGFSAFLFNSSRQFLIQKRITEKKTWGGFWSNSFCGHPQINETYEQAVARHAKFELGIELQAIHFVAHYRYKFSIGDIVENEICPIYLVLSDDAVVINKDEVEEIQLLSWHDFLLYAKQNHEQFTPWCMEEAELLEGSGILKKFMDSSS